jgi:twitching motility protein PilT
MSQDPAGRMMTLLHAMIARDASDLHLVPGYQPMLRIHGRLLPADDSLLAPDDILPMLLAVAPPGSAERLTAARPGDNRSLTVSALNGTTDLDFAASIEHQGRTVRFRVNMFSSRGTRGVCFRLIPSCIPDVDELGLPRDLVDRIDRLRSGLTLVTGITGSGKTTSLAALVQRFNAAGGFRIITIEEPIEYLFPRCDKSVVTQREVGVDVASFYDGLRFGLRQDADIILVGEIRDRETAQLALSAAETGHLIFATLHTSDAKGAITRLVDLFPSEVHDDVRAQLALSLQHVVAQHLLPGPDPAGRRVLAVEALTANFAVRSAIRAGKIEMLDSAIQSGRKDGMISLDAYLRDLVQQGRIDLATARQFAKDPAELGG